MQKKKLYASSSNVFKVACFLSEVCTFTFPHPFRSLWCWPSFHTGIIKVLSHLSFGKHWQELPNLIRLPSQVLPAKANLVCAEWGPWWKQHGHNCELEIMKQTQWIQCGETGQGHSALLQSIPTGIALKRLLHLFLSKLLGLIPQSEKPRLLRESVGETSHVLLPYLSSNMMNVPQSQFPFHSLQKQQFSGR